MKVTVGNQEITVQAVYEEKRTVDDEQRDAIRIQLDGGLTPEQYTALREHALDVDDGYKIYEGYSEELEHYLVLVKGPDGVLQEARQAAQAAQAQAERAQEVAEVKTALLSTVADALPDEIAVQHVEIYPAWEEYIGKTLPADKRVRYEDGLYRVQQEHTPQAHQPPSVHTAALYTRIQPDTGPEEWVPGQSYAKDVEVTHNGGVWLSGVDNNVWEPGGAGVYDNIWKRVRDA